MGAALAPRLWRGFNPAEFAALAPLLPLEPGPYRRVLVVATADDGETLAREMLEVALLVRVDASAMMVQTVPGPLPVMLKLLLIVAAGYGFLVAIAFFAQKSLLYLPTMPGRELTESPAGIGLAYEDVAIRTEDGFILHGWFIPAASSRVLLFFHGNAGNISHRLASIRQFHSLGLSILIVDYRGYGQSEGKPSEAGLQRDAEAAWRYLTGTRKVAPEDVVIFGRSLGGAVAAWLATRTQPGALIVESAFTSVPDIAGEVYPWLPVRWLSRLQHATRDYIRDVRCPVLVIHSHDDEIIPYHHGERIFEAANEPRALLTITGGHNDGFVSDEDRYVEGIRDFLSEIPSSEGGVNTPMTPISL